MIKSQIVELIGRRRRQILVHSCLYYQFNENLISDVTYDAWAKQLAELMSSYPEEAKAAPLAKEFEGFSSETTSGFLLPYSNPDVTAKAIQLLRYKKKGRAF